MTYKESLEIAFRYADSAESDFDYKEMFYSLADEAQKLIATQGDKIIKRLDIEVSDNLLYKLPDDFYEFKGIVYADSRLNADIGIYETGNIVLPKAGKYILSYYALPKTIDENTPDDYQYEVPLYTHVAIPYYIAYRLVGTDDVTLYTALKNQWDLYMSVFNQTGRAKSRQIKNVYAR